MPRLFGRELPASELRRFIGGAPQLAGIRTAELSDGAGRGMRVADVWTGSGLRFQVLIDRALDIGAADHGGRPLAWVHPALGPPARFEPEGYGWLRTFGGGLVTTCGLVHFGQPETERGQAHGLHGRIGHVPAENVRVAQEWRGEDYALEIEGDVRETSALGENLLLRRRITTRLGASVLVIEDRVRNEGFRHSPVMVLYHCNLGFPVVSPESELVTGPGPVTPRDDVARAGLAASRRFEEPDPAFGGQVYFLAPRPGRDGTAAAAVVNRPLGLGLSVRWRTAELPCFAWWKMMRPGDYVCALEPCTHWEAPRAQLREEGRLRMLAPGEEVGTRVEIGVLEGAEAIGAFETTLAG
jgi:uncharacterized protein DUF4432